MNLYHRQTQDLEFFRQMNTPKLHNTAHGSPMILNRCFVVFNFQCRLSNDFKMEISRKLMQKRIGGQLNISEYNDSKSMEREQYPSSTVRVRFCTMLVNIWLMNPGSWGPYDDMLVGPHPAQTRGEYEVLSHCFLFRLYIN